jgi:hypothetical protein
VRAGVGEPGDVGDRIAGHAEAEVAGPSRLGAKDQFAGSRVHPIGAHQHVEARLSAIGEGHVHAGVALVHRGDALPVADLDLVPYGGSEDILESAVHQREVRAAQHLLHQPPVQACRDPLHGVDEGDRVRAQLPGGELVPKPHAAGNLVARAGEVDAIAANRAGLGALDDDGRVPLLKQPVCTGQAGNATTGNEHLHERHPIIRSPSVFKAAAL